MAGDTDRAGAEGLPPPGGGCCPLTDHPPPEAPRDHAGTDRQHEGLVWNVCPVSPPSHKPCRWKCTYQAWGFNDTSLYTTICFGIWFFFLRITAI